MSAITLRVGKIVHTTCVETIESKNGVALSLL